MANDDQHPGVFLNERYLRPLNITTSDLAEALNVKESRILDLVEGRSPITPDMAARLGLYFEVPARWWLERQARYDAEHVAELEALRDEVTPYPELKDVLITPNGVKPLGPQRQSPAKTMTVKVSEDFLERLRAQVRIANADLVLAEK